MQCRGARLFGRCALLVTVALGVLVMHHAPAIGQAHFAVQHSSSVAASVELEQGWAPADPPGESGSHLGGLHELLHFCLAVISVGLGIAMALRLARTPRGYSRRVLTLSVVRPATARGPPVRPGRAILLDVCVLHE